MVFEATVTAPVNIACIKSVAGPHRRASIDISLRYWGKRDTALILPTNSSLSITLDQDHLRSTTTSRCDPSFEGSDRLWLNGKEETIKQGGRTWVCIRELKKWRAEMEENNLNLPKVSLPYCSLCNRQVHEIDELE